MLDVLLLSAGFGSRLGVYTETFPKCLMPVGTRPILDVWFDKLEELSSCRCWVNTHFQRPMVREFLLSSQHRGFPIRELYEPELLGTAGTMLKLVKFRAVRELLVIHADNVTNLQIKSFLEDATERMNRNNALMAIAAFKSSETSSVGILDFDDNDILQAILEKDPNASPGWANSAIYYFSEEALNVIRSLDAASDIVTEILPLFWGKALVVKHRGYNVDIGTPAALLRAQSLPEAVVGSGNSNDWIANYKSTEIVQKVIAAKIKNG